MARLREYKRVYGSGISRPRYRSLNHAYKEWEWAYKQFKKNGSAMAYFEARRAGEFYRDNGGTRKVIIPKTLVLEADTKRSRTYRDKKTGKLVTVEPPKPKEKKKKSIGKKNVAVKRSTSKRSTSKRSTSKRYTSKKKGKRK